MSAIENADVTLRMPLVLAELAEKDFLVCSCLFQFRFKNKYELFFYSLVLPFESFLVSI